MYSIAELPVVAVACCTYKWSSGMWLDLRHIMRFRSARHTAHWKDIRSS